MAGEGRPIAAEGAARRAPAWLSGWVLPAAVPVLVGALALLLSLRLQEAVIGAVVAAAAVWLLWRRPAAALLGLVVFLPFEQVGLPLLLRAGLPPGAVRAAGAFKETAAVILAGHAAGELLSGRRRLSALDKAVLAYVAVVTLYLVAPDLLSPGAPLALTPRLLAWRADCGYALLIVAVRHAPVAPRLARRFATVLVAVTAVVVAAGLYERLQPGGFSHFVTSTAGVPRYETTVLHEPAAKVPVDLQYVTNPAGTGLRVSSLLLDPFDLGDYLLIPLAVLLESVTRGDRSLRRLAVLAGVAATVVLTKTRSDLLALAAVWALALRPSPGRLRAGRRRLAYLAVAGCLLAAPLVAGSRITGSQGGAASSADHISELLSGLRTFEAHPLGLGLGDQAATATRFATVNPSLVRSDDAPLQVADELGVLGLGAWVVMWGTAFAELRRRRAQPLAAAGAMALAGVLVAGLFHSTFAAYPAPWTLGLLLGMALAPGEDRSAPEPDRAGHALMA